ncbi:MAG TPA: glycosyltransferase [Rhodocyclaceae bacterium]
MSRRELRILTWHVHGNYLYYLTQVPQRFHVLADAARSPGYGGRAGHLPWGDNVVELRVEEAADAAFDCILFQSRRAWEEDQYRWLSEAQRRLPRIYLEHDPPQQHPTDSRHPVDDPAVLLVHVTHFNRLMWDSGRTPTRVVEHGVLVDEAVRYDGRLARGIAVVNNMRRRGRRLGADLFEAMRRRFPLDLVGMDAQASGGLGEIRNPELPAFLAPYRFYFHPVRWTSLGLSLIEAMSIGLPVVGLATTELATVIRSGESGFIDTDPEALAAGMALLLSEPEEARRMGAAARRLARERFGIGRFVADWLKVFEEATR